MAFSKNYTNVDGYVHQVSDVKIPRSGNHNARFFDFKIQEGEGSRRVVCFSPDKRDDLKEKELSKIPVSLLSVSPQKRKYQADETEYKMHTFSKVVPKKNLSFPWKERTSEKHCTLKDISSGEKSNIKVDDMVRVNAKVVYKSEVESVFSSKLNKNLTKCDIIIADPTDAMRVVLWEEAIEQIEVDISYSFRNLKVCYFNSKYLNGTQELAVEVCTDDVELSPESTTAAERLIPKKKEVAQINGRVMAIDVEKDYVCLNCKTRAATDDDDDENSGEDLIRCLSCKLSMLKEDLEMYVTAHIIIVDENRENLGRFYCSRECLSDMFSSIASSEGYNIEETDTSKLSKKMIIKTLLLIKKISFEVVKEDKIIKSMSVC